MRIGPSIFIAAPFLVACEAAEILDASVSCEADIASFTIETSQPTEFATVFSQETGNPQPQYSDEHEFPADGVEQLLVVSLDTGVPNPNPNRSTLFSCPGHHGAPLGVMTYAYRIYDENGELTDCLVQGDDPEGLILEYYDRVNDPDAPGELESCRRLAGTY